MKNREKWAKELIECALSVDGVTLLKGVPVNCGAIPCDECDLAAVCIPGDTDVMRTALHAWAEAEAGE